MRSFIWMRSGGSDQSTLFPLWFCPWFSLSEPRHWQSDGEVGDINKRKTQAHKKKQKTKRPWTPLNITPWKMICLWLSRCLVGGSTAWCRRHPQQCATNAIKPHDVCQGYTHAHAPHQLCSIWVRSNRNNFISPHSSAPNQIDWVPFVTAAALLERNMTDKRTLVIS